MVYKCILCNSDFEKESNRGRTPYYCSSCKTKGKQRVYRSKRRVKAAQVDLVEVQDFMKRFPNGWKYRPAIVNLYLKFGEKVALYAYEQMNACVMSK